MFKYLILNHIPRCGGSSLKLSFHNATKNNEYFKNHPIYISEHTHNNMCLFDRPELIAAIHPDTLLFIDHSPSGYVEKIFNIDKSIAYRILTIRNPINRIISHIHHFYGVHIESLPLYAIENYLDKFGHCTISWLTNTEFPHKDIQYKYEKAKEELETYNFIFQTEKQDLMKLFNDNNPFGLRLSNFHINRAQIDSNIEIGTKTKNLIYQSIKLEIQLLEKFYEMDI